ncbi:hypothetical protein ACWC2T_30245 [Streptomyces sp. NPDC001393]
MFRRRGPAAQALNSPPRLLTRHLSCMVERWADEEAALATCDRRRVARTIGKAALARRRTAPEHVSPNLCPT